MSDAIDEYIERAGQLLPMPGPITAFGFLNTLQALEDLPFEEGMRRGARLYGCEPLMLENRYRAMLPRGRIQIQDLAEVLKRELGAGADQIIGKLSSRYAIRLAMIQHPLQVGPAEELRWFVAEMDALSKFQDSIAPPERERFVEETRHWVQRDLFSSSDPIANRAREILADLRGRFGESSIEHWNEPVRKWEKLTLQVLWRVCREGVTRVKRFDTPPTIPLRHRDVIQKAGGGDSDLLVHGTLMRFCAAFTDQGFAHWPLPNREQGFFVAFCDLFRQRWGTAEPWIRGLPNELDRVVASQLSPHDSIVESLDLLGVSAAECEDYITASLLALRGWAGMLWQMDVRSDRVPNPVPKGTLTEFLAVRLILERLALAYVARETLGYTGPINELRNAIPGREFSSWKTSLEQKAFIVFQLAQALGWSPPKLFHLSAGDWTDLVAEIECFPGSARRWVYHQAFELRYQRSALDAISIHARLRPERVPNPRFQATFCLDAREESIRRRIEELAPDTETFGAPGFYAVAMYYRGIAEAHFSALCPIVVRPQHWVVEEVSSHQLQVSRRQAHTRQLIGNAAHRIHVGSRSFAGGALLTASLGVLATIPLIGRVLFPRLTAAVRRRAGTFVQPPLMTRLRLERSAPTAGPTGDQIGYSLEEMSNIGERMLRDIGLTSGFARLVLIFGHGSFCLNNPHKSAYDCGACTGSPGGPNGRALAAMLNDDRVRAILAERGLLIPSSTRFIGGMHNTATETFEFLDLDLLPTSHIQDFEVAKQILEDACQRNAHERCRRFDSAPLDISYEEAHRHVEKRSEDLAQTRPEFGNASNALCIVGRRERTRGLFLDRRSFLTSYDPTQDDAESSILARILSAAIPVCEGINMQYNLSYIDSNGWACGTKLPHNVVSLLGVMLGAASDLKPGLPWQSVEIHEPMRLMFVIETTTDAMFKIMSRNPVIDRILKNRWSHLAVLDPGSNRIQVFDGKQFHDFIPEAAGLTHVATSTDWYRGWREHLGFAVIERGCLARTTQEGGAPHA